MAKIEWLGEGDHSERGQPGDQYRKRWAGVQYLERADRYELKVVIAWGSNQGHLEEHGRIERRYRHTSLDELMAIGLSEIRVDAAPSDLGPILQAIRDAIYAAQDAETERN